MVFLTGLYAMCKKREIYFFVLKTIWIASLPIILIWSQWTMTMKMMKMPTFPVVIGQRRVLNESFIVHQ